MKKIEALFRRERIAEVSEALQKQGFATANISETERLAGVAASSQGWLVSSRELDALAYVKLEMLVHHDALYRAVEAIKRSAATGQPDDGTILVTPVESVAPIEARGPLYSPDRSEVGAPLAD